MKYFSFFIVVLSQLTLASEWDEYFKSGNQAYNEGNYETAITEYQKIIDYGIESGEVYFNLGNAYYKINEIGRAILFYEKAQKFLEGDEALQQNLKIASLKIIDKIEPIPELFINAWWKKLIHLISIESLGWLSLISFVLFSQFLALYIIYRKKMFSRTMWIFSIICVIIFVVYIGRIYEFETTQFGIIFDKKISVVSEPGLGASELFILHEGTKVMINRTTGDWYEVTIADGKTGWCKSQSIGII